MRSAVRQWPGNVADLDFACVIREAPVFLLVAMHLPEVEALSQEDAFKKLVPESAKTKCAFYRVWVSRYGKKLEPFQIHCLPTRLLSFTTILCVSLCSVSSSRARRSRVASPW